MLKWLKDRELGNAVNRKTVYKRISMGPKFAYRGIIDYTSHERDKMIVNLKWTSDGYYLVSLDEEFDEDDDDGNAFYRITFWENPNTHTKQKVKSTIDLCNLKAIENRNWHDACYWSMECHHSDIILGGFWEGEGLISKEGFIQRGFICFVSMSTGQLKEFIRNVFIAISM